jgi:hypothetical protein
LNPQPVANPLGTQRPATIRDGIDENSTTARFFA